MFRILVVASVCFHGLSIFCGLAQGLVVPNRAFFLSRLRTVRGGSTTVSRKPRRHSITSWPYGTQFELWLGQPGMCPRDGMFGPNKELEIDRPMSFECPYHFVHILTLFALKDVSVHPSRIGQQRSYNHFPMKLVES
mgnify:CR=1 FL=1